MTTKHKIVIGFLFMVAVQAALAAFGWFSLNNATTGFNDYRVSANAAVQANSADALLREAKDRVNNFVQTLKPDFVAQAQNALAGSIEQVQRARGFETDSTQQNALSTQMTRIKEMEGLMKSVEEKLLRADAVVNKKMNPAAAQINQRLTDINAAARDAGNAEVLALIDDAYSIFTDLRVVAGTYSVSYLPEDAEKSFEMFQSFAALLPRMESAIRLETTRRAYGALKQTYEVYFSAFKDMDAAIREASQARRKMNDTAAEISTFFDRYTEDAQKDMDGLGISTNQSNESAQALMLSVGSGGFVLGLLLAAWIIVGVVRVLHRVAGFAGEVARGNFKAQLPVKEGGEIGSMVKSILEIPTTLNGMAAEYKRVEQGIEEGRLDIQADAGTFSGGFADLLEGTNNILKRVDLIFDNIPSPMVMLNKDLKAAYLNKTAQDLAGAGYHGKTCEEMFAREDYGSSACGLMRAVRTGEICTAETVARPRGKRMDIRYTATPMKNAQGRLSSVLQFIVDLTQIKDTERTIVSVAEQALENADRVAAASEQLSAQVEQVSRGAEMQRERVESTAAAMNEMNATVLEVARNAGNASEQSEETRRKADGGADLVNKVVKAINGVNTVAVSLQENMTELGKQAESIGGVMNVISDIADQTNLLALNAAIEAARAGEAGRGFAVVADEVRKLAEKTMSATHEVGGNIQAIQHSARTNINEVTGAVKNIAEATELANASGRALSEIVGLAGANSSIVASIATAAEEQSAASEEINHALTDVSRIVAETSDGMTQASAAVQDLSQVAQNLKTIIRRLRGK